METRQVDPQSLLASQYGWIGDHWNTQTRTHMRTCTHTHIPICTNTTAATVAINTPQIFLLCSHLNFIDHCRQIQNLHSVNVNWFLLWKQKKDFCTDFDSKVLCWPSFPCPTGLCDIDLIKITFFLFCGLNGTKLFVFLAPVKMSQMYLWKFLPLAFLELSILMFSRLFLII